MFLALNVQKLEGWVQVLGKLQDLTTLISLFSFNLAKCEGVCGKVPRVCSSALA